MINAYAKELETLSLVVMYMIVTQKIYIYIWYQKKKKKALDFLLLYLQNLFRLCNQRTDGDAESRIVFLKRALKSRSCSLP